MKIVKHIFYLNSYWNDFGSETKIITALEIWFFFDLYLFVKKSFFNSIQFNAFIGILFWTIVTVITSYFNQKYYQKNKNKLKIKWESESVLFKSFFRIFNIVFVGLSFAILILLSTKA